MFEAFIILELSLMIFIGISIIVRIGKVEHTIETLDKRIEYIESHLNI